MIKPTRSSYNLEEINKNLTEWMLETFGYPMEMDEEERNIWYQNHGMIHHFLACYFPDSEGNFFTTKD